MSDANDELVCPECGGPIGQTATYCMHCSADLTEERDAADADDDGVWDQAESSVGWGERSRSEPETGSESATGTEPSEAADYAGTARRRRPLGPRNSSSIPTASSTTR